MQPLSVAPMMDITDRHFRSFLRCISKRTVLYTEMVTEQAIRFGDAERLLAFSPAEEPLVLQLGGSDPDGLASAVRTAWQLGYSEINLNVGCPSDRVQSGRFGACLMLDPPHVAKLVSAMQAASPLPVTVKHRIGVDDQDSYGQLLNFVDTVAEAGVSRFTVHARKAWLQGLSPRENREIPPLRHDVVQRLAAERPELQFELNGGVRSLAQARDALSGNVSGVMIGRAVVDNPWLLAGADPLFWDSPAPATDPRQAVLDWLPYVEAMLAAGVPLRTLVRPLLGMFGGARGARAWRRHLSENAGRPGSGVHTVTEALSFVDTDQPVTSVAGDGVKLQGWNSSPG